MLGQTLGDGEGQGGLACCSPLGRKESDTTGRLNNSNNNLMNKILDFSIILFIYIFFM